MKSNTVTKIKISIFLFLISLIYFSSFDFLLGKLGFSLFVFGTFLFYSFFLVFIYPYIKINSQSLLKRSLFFGLMVWIIDLPEILMNLRQTLMMADIPRIFLFIKNPLYFLILGFLISLCYKKFLPTEFNLPVQKLKIPFLKTILLIILSVLIYSTLVYSAEVIILFWKGIAEALSEYIGNFLNPVLYIDPLIYGLLFTLVYLITIARAGISRVKKWFIFSLFVAFFTTPLILIGGRFFSYFPGMKTLLFVPHLISIFVIGYILSVFLNKRNFVLFITIAVILIIVSGGIILTSQQEKLEEKELEALPKKQIEEVKISEEKLEIKPTQKEIFLLENQIENWSLYQETTKEKDKWVGAGLDCGNKEFKELLIKAKQGSMKILRLNNALDLVITPNYKNWTAEEFIEFNYDPTAVCGVGGRYPLYAYPDKLLWVGSCGSGFAPEITSPIYIYKEWEENQIRCEKAFRVVKKFFEKKETADWKTYRNEEYGFEIKYPPQYRIADNAGTDVGPAIIEDWVEIIFRDFTGYFTKEEIENIKNNSEKIKIGSLEAFTGSLGGNMDGGIEFSIAIFDYPKEGMYFNILFSTLQPGRESEIKIFKQMLSTFRFLE